MSRILDYITKYDETLTIEQFKEVVELEQISAKETEISNLEDTIYELEQTLNDK